MIGDSDPTALIHLPDSPFVAEGAEAYALGALRRENPFDPSSCEAKEWDDGWRGAELDETADIGSEMKRSLLV